MGDLSTSERPTNGQRRRRTLAKARVYTTAWRAERKAKGCPEARQIDRAVLKAIMRASNDGPVDLRKAALDAIDDLARKHPRGETTRAVGRRMTALRGVYNRG